MSRAYKRAMKKFDADANQKEKSEQWHKEQAEARKKYEDIFYRLCPKEDSNNFWETFLAAFVTVVNSRNPDNQQLVFKVANDILVSREKDQMNKIKSDIANEIYYALKNNT